MADFDCPYCGTAVSVCHDDGAGYAESEKHQQTCGSCDKVFVFTTRISYHYDVAAAECLNDAPHEWRQTSTWPKQYTRWRCAHCDEEKALTPDEMALLLLNEQPEKTA